MPRGGARNRSGPQPTEGSRTSDRKGFSLTALPESYDGEAPDFPLPAALNRELEVWADVWTYPQAHFWAANPRLWRHLAMYVRNSVRTEDPEASAALVNVVMRYADDVGISEAGMRFHGLKVAEATTPAAATGPTEVEDDPRLRLVQGSGA
jgi:hypothetical protein